MNNSIESIEKLLKAAANFESAQPCPDDIVDRAMSRVRGKRRFTAGWAFAVGGCALTWLAFNQLRTPAVRISTGRHSERNSPVIALNPYGNPGKVDVSPHKTVIKPPSRRERKTTNSKVAARNPRYITRRKHPGVDPPRSAVRQRPMMAALQKAIWRDEEVHSYRTGVVAAALVMSADEDNRIHLQPGIIQVPLAEGQLIARSGAGSTKEEQQ